MDRGCWYKDVVPFMAMVSVECTNVGLNTLFKAATERGMNYFVFILYSYLAATLLLLPMPFIFLRRADLPPLTFPILFRIFLLGMLGLSAQMIGYKGIEYSSPTLSSAISNLTAAFTFILAILFRMEKLTLRSWRTRAKIAGTVVSISGALIVVLYKGPAILSLGSSSQANWVIGGLLLVLQYLLFSFWYIFQTKVMKMYPAELVVAFLYNLSLVIIAAPMCLLSERNLSSWRLRSDIATVAIVYSGLLGSSYSTVLHSWGLRLKGPVYIASFRPLSIAIAAAMGVMFLGDALTIGSVVGAIIISAGFYAVLWGKAKEEDKNEEEGGFGSRKSLSPPPSFTSKSPLLQRQNIDVNI